MRVEEDGSGTLIVNASQIYYFNPTATLLAYDHLQDVSVEKSIQHLTHTFAVDKDQAVSDYRTFQTKFEPIISPDSDACPFCDLELETIAPFSKKPFAPYRMDLALTYRCNNDCLHCYNDPTRKTDELDTQAWKLILEKVWEIGIPHVVFTGGEPTLREDLPKLVKHAQGIGLITGINTNGRKLGNPEYLQSLIDAGLDHVQITLESHDKAIHDEIVSHAGAWEQTVAGLRNIINSKLYVMTNTTLLQKNSPKLETTLQFLHDLKVPTIGLNGLIHSGKGITSQEGIEEKDLPDLLNLASRFTKEHGQRLIWYTPTQYCHFDPVSFGLGVKGCSAALYNLCVEPDGSVLPCQSYYQSLGNLLHDSWDSIWNHDLAVSIREKRHLQDKCTFCNLLSECGGGCPLYSQNQIEALSEKQSAIMP